MSGYVETMPSIMNPSGRTADYGQRTGTLTEHASYVSASRDIDSQIMIKTKEGDVVTLSSNSSYDFESIRYDREGRIRNENGSGADSSMSYRKMTLAAGESFEFSVKGDLSEEELDDIQQIVSDIDGILEQMTEGDMKEAVGLAMEMGGYDSVARLSADLSVKQSYRAVSQSSLAQYAESHSRAPEHETESASLFDRAGKIAEKVREQLEDVEEQLRERSRQPLEQLFAKHENRWRRNRNTPEIGKENAPGEIRHRFNRWPGFYRAIV
ncbi:MAG: hypothetical protein K9J83_07655 [Desulfarculaceae bacterium]|nr:hypothetical protein [Desulfarculaceae bacterium]